MKLHTVFVTYNRFELTKQAIASYLETVTVPFTLAVVDNGSTDGTQEWLRGFADDNPQHEIVLLPKNMYPGFACNRGWELAPPDATHLQRADNDWAFLPKWCDYLQAAFRGRRVGQVGLRTNREECFPDGRTVPWNVGGNNAILRELWDQGLRYDETPWPKLPPGLSEDTFLSPAVREMGYKWMRVARPCIVGISTESIDDPYYRKSWGDRRIYASKKTREKQERRFRQHRQRGG